MLKKCKTCHKDKEESKDFYNNKGTYINFCKECRRIEDRLRARENYTIEKSRRTYKRLKDRLGDKFSEFQRKKAKIHPEKHKARRTLRNAVKLGKIKKPTDCEMLDIGSACFGKIEGHHPDYSKPLEVKWLCSKHHGEVHRIP